MKKITAILLAVLLTMSLFGCSRTEPGMTTEPNREPTTEPGTVATTESTTEPTAEPTTEQPHTHSYTGKTTAPACESEGYTEYTCSCGDSYKSDYKDATGHDYKTETVDPTHSSKGYDLHTCKTCGKSYMDNYTDKLPKPTEHVHEWVWTEYVGPYACREGYNLYTCACGESYKEGTGDVMDCDWQIDQIVEPTTESEGYTVYKCSVCGKTYKDNYKDKLPAQTEPTEPAQCTNHSAGDGWLDTLPHHMEGYMVKCKCAPDVDFHADTKDGAVALHGAHKAECAGDGENHDINGIYEEWYIETPITFECVHCGETCATYKYYKYSATHYAVMIYNG